MALAGLTGVYLGFLGVNAPAIGGGSFATVAAGSAAGRGAPGASTTGGSPTGGRAGGPPSSAGARGTGTATTAPAAGTAKTAPAAGTAKTAAATGANTKTAPSASASKTATGTAKTAPAAKGPLLSSTRWWPYAHQLYPTSPSATTSMALTGFRVSFSKVSASLERVQVDTGRGKPQAATFRRTDRLYMIEGGMGDDGFHQDTNFGDDAFVLTDAGGHIVGK